MTDWWLNMGISLPDWFGYLPTLLQGVNITLQITGAGLLLGLVIALSLTWVLERRIPVLAQVTEGYL